MRSDKIEKKTEFNLKGESAKVGRKRNFQSRQGEDPDGEESRDPLPFCVSAPALLPQIRIHLTRALGRPHTELVVLGHRVHLGCSFDGGVSR